MRICARAWGSHATGWRFCKLESGHTCECIGYDGPKPPEAIFRDQQPEYEVDVIQRQIDDERKENARKAQKRGAKFALE